MGDPLRSVSRRGYTSINFYLYTIDRSGSGSYKHTLHSDDLLRRYEVRVSFDDEPTTRAFKEKVTEETGVTLRRQRYYALIRSGDGWRVDSEQILCGDDKSEKVLAALANKKGIHECVAGFLPLIGVVFLTPGDAGSGDGDEGVEIERVVSAEEVHENRVAQGRANAVEIADDSGSGEDDGSNPRKPKRRRRARDKARHGVDSESIGRDAAGGTVRAEADEDDGGAGPVQKDGIGNGNDTASDSGEVARPARIRTAPEPTTVRQWLRLADDEEGDRLEREYGDAFDRNFANFRLLELSVKSKHVGTGQILRDCGVTTLGDKALLGRAMDGL